MLRINRVQVRRMLARDLSTRWPGVTFKVEACNRTCLCVTWTDGPSVGQVQAVTTRYEGTVRGNTPTKAAQHVLASGRVERLDLIESVPGASEPVRVMTDFIFCERRYTLPTVQRAADTLAVRGVVGRVKVREVAPEAGGGYDIQAEYPREAQTEVLQELDAMECGAVNPRAWPVIWDLVAAAAFLLSLVTESEPVGVGLLAVAVASMGAAFWAAVEAEEKEDDA